MASRINDDLHVGGHLTSTTASLPAGTVTNAMVNGSAAIEATKLIHQFCAQYIVADGTNVAATSGDGVPIHTVYGSSCTVAAVEVVCPDAPSGGDLKFTVDVGYANASTAYTSILTAVVDYANGTTDYTALPGTLDTTSLSAEDTIMVKVAVSGSTGTQGQGLIVNVWLREASA